MAGRLVLGVVAAARAVLIPGQADVLMARPLSWPRPRVVVARLRGTPGRRTLVAGP